VASVEATPYAEVGDGALMLFIEGPVEAEVGGVVSLEGAVNAEVGSSSGEGVEEMSESQNISGDLTGAVASPINLEDGICRRLSTGRRRGAATVPL
jgi:hypothetical protein